MSSKVNLLVLCGSLFPRGGTEICVSDTIRALAERGHRVTAVSADEASPPGLTPLCRWESIPDLFSSSLRPKAVWRCWRARWQLHQLLQRDRIEVALLNIDSPVTLQALQARLPTISFVHSPGTHCPSGTRWLPRSRRACDAKAGMGCVLVDRKEGCLVDGSGRRLRPWAAFRRIVDVPIQAHFLRSSTLVAANSEHTARHVERLAGASTRIRLLYPPLADTTAADRPPISNRLFVAGRLTATKGIADAIKVTASLPQTILTVAGDGPQRVELEALCRHLGVTKRVRFLGWVPSQVVDQEIKKASVVLFPSLWPEPFGLAGAQGAVNGRPVVAYDSGGIRSWLSPDMGALVPVGDVEALTRAAERLCSDSDHALRCGRSARSAVENLLLPRFGERVEVLLHEAIELGRRTSI